MAKKNPTYNTIIIGSGSAGMQCALTLNTHAIKIIIIDENPQLGGQIYRNVLSNSEQISAILGDDYNHGKSLAQSVLNSNIEIMYSTTLWNIENENAMYTVYVVQNGKTICLHTKHIVIATGAIERPMPIKGWTSAGVMTAGSAQILLKSSGVVSHDAVFIGSGALLFLIACQYLNADVKIKAIIDTTPKANYMRAMCHIFGAIKNYKTLIKGFKMLAQIKKSGVPYITGITDINIIESDNITTSVSYTKAKKNHTISTDTVFLHQGVIPNVNITNAIGCDHTWDEQNLSWNVTTDIYNQTSMPNIYCIGDGAKIGGAISAKHSGTISALNILRNTKNLSDKADIIKLQNQAISLYNKELSIRPFLNVLYSPAISYQLPTGDTIVCRCEEQSADTVISAISLGVQGPNQLKAFTRCGMGACQGRYCSSTIGTMIRHHAKLPMEKIGQYKLRTPFKPIRLKNLIIK